MLIEYSEWMKSAQLGTFVLCVNINTTYFIEKIWNVITDGIFPFTGFPGKAGKENGDTDGIISRERWHDFDKPES